MSEGRDPDRAMPDDAALEAEAQAFEDPEDKTSPEVLRPGVRPSPVAPVATHTNPMIVVASQDAGLRRDLVELLWTDGWTAVEATDADELLETCRARAPHVAVVDARLKLSSGLSVPEAVRSYRPEAAIRVMALLQAGDTEEVAGAVADGYDDFIMDPGNQVEVLARCTASLRACRSLQDLFKQRRDAASLLELSQTLASSLDLQLILHTVSRQIADVIALERCSIILLDPDHDDAVMVAASEDRSVRDLRIQLSNYPELKRCVEAAAPIIIEDASIDPLLDGVRDQVSAAGVRTMALFPIVFEERVTGVLFLRSSKPGRKLNPHDVQFGLTVASACAVAIRNARLFDSFRDQTERMNYMRLVAERQMEALKKYEDFFEYAADGMAIVNTDAEILYVNREGRRLLGREQDETRGQTFLDFVADESKVRWQETVEGVLKGRFRRSFDFYVLRGDGTERIFWLSAGGVGQDTGLIILSFRDVTETREMELELRTTKEFLENLIDNSVDAIVAADMSGNIMLFNKGAEKIYGYKAEEVIGRMHVSELYPGHVAHEIMRQLRDHRWGGRGRLEAQRKVIRNVHGEIVPVSMTASLIYEDGEEVATVGVFTDLRDRLKIEQRLSDAQEELLKTEKARVAADLAGMAAHELNQPLTSVLGYAEMLRHRVDEDDQKVRRCVDIIYSQAERMAEIVRKIGRITKYETKHYGARTTMMDLERASAPDEGLRSGDGASEVDTLDVPHGELARDPEETPPEERRSVRQTGSFRVRPGTFEREGPPRERSSGSSRLMAALASMPLKDETTARAAIVRLDTVDDEPRARRQHEEVTDPSVRRRRLPSTPPPKSAALLDDIGAEEQPPELERTNPGVKVNDVSPTQATTEEE